MSAACQHEAERADTVEHMFRENAWRVNTHCKHCNCWGSYDVTQAEFTAGTKKPYRWHKEWKPCGQRNWHESRSPIARAVNAIEGATWHLRGARLPEEDLAELSRATEQLRLNINAATEPKAWLTDPPYKAYRAS